MAPLSLASNSALIPATLSFPPEFRTATSRNYCSTAVQNLQKGSIKNEVDCINCRSDLLGSLLK
jgi:hypothetical protein